MSAPVGLEPEVELLKETIRCRWPGGRHVAPHLEDGPWTMVAVTAYDNPNWLVEMAAKAYPGRDAHYLRDGDILGAQTLYVLPQFATNLFEWYAEENELELNYDLIGLAWSVRPEPEYAWAVGLLSGMLVPAPETAAHQLLPNRAAYDALMGHIRSLYTQGTQEQVVDDVPASITQFLRAFAAAK